MASTALLDVEESALKRRRIDLEELSREEDFEQVSLPKEGRDDSPREREEAQVRVVEDLSRPKGGLEEAAWHDGPLQQCCDD